ncbi:MAG: hypothetical protein CR975_04935 [Gammaproteobacteria bacterium]|nr:MAG: hypothetical protein CR975_04935 [Gammaproteobacteria bacterium]
MITALFAFLGYVASVLLLHRQEKTTDIALVSAMGIGIAAHLAQVLMRLNGVMYDVSVMNVLTLTAACMTIIGAVRYFIHADSVAYTVVALVAAVCVWFPVFFKAPLTAVNSWSLKVHITLSIAAYIALGFAALYACLLLLQDYRLRRARRMFRLNLPLNYLERTMMSFTVFGELLLTLSLATGLLFIRDLWGQHIVHKVVFGAVAWLVIAILLFRHYHQGFRGRRAAIVLLGGFACLVLSYFGSAFVLQMVLHKV